MGRRRGGGTAVPCGSRREQVLPHVAAHRVEQVDRSGMEAPHLLATHDLAVDVALLDQQRVLAHVLHLERQ